MKKCLCPKILNKRANTKPYTQNHESETTVSGTEHSPVELCLQKCTVRCKQVIL